MDSRDLPEGSSRDWFQERSARRFTDIVKASENGLPLRRIKDAWTGPKRLVEGYLKRLVEQGRLTVSEERFPDPRGRMRMSKVYRSPESRIEVKEPEHTPEFTQWLHAVLRGDDLTRKGRDPS